MKTSFATESRGNSRGFTLVEMLVTITIIVILAGLSLGGMQYVNAKQANEQARIQIALLSKGLEEYKLDNGDYPGPPDAGGTAGTGQSNVLFKALYWEGSGNSGAPRGTIYVTELDPENNRQGWTTTGQGENTTITDPWGSEYRYRRGTGAMNPDFDLWSVGRDASDGTSDDIKNF